MFNWSFRALRQELGLRHPRWLASVAAGEIVTSGSRALLLQLQDMRPIDLPATVVEGFSLDLCPCSEIAVRTLMAQLDLTLNVRDTVPSISSAR